MRSHSKEIIKRPQILLASKGICSVADGEENSESFEY